MERESSVEELKGVGPKTAQLFRKIDVLSVGEDVYKRQSLSVEVLAVRAQGRTYRHL